MAQSSFTLIKIQSTKKPEVTQKLIEEYKAKKFDENGLIPYTNSKR